MVDEVKITRRDMIEVEALAKKPFSKLFPDGEATAEGTLAMSYVQEKKAGETDLSYEDWLDEDAVPEELADSDEDEEANPI